MSRGQHRSPAADACRVVAALRRVLQCELVLPSPALENREMTEDVGQATIVALVLGACPHRMQPGTRILEPVYDLQENAESHVRPVTNWRGHSLGLQGDCPLQGRHGEAVAEATPVQRQIGKSVRQEVRRRRVDALQQLYGDLR